MNEIHMLAYRLLWCLSSPLLACVVVLHGGNTEPRGAGEHTVGIRAKVAAIIARLASKNAPPELRGAEDPRRGRPVFQDNYDWMEQVRVLAAVKELLDEKSSAGFDELLAHFDDSRYCVTLALDGEADWGRNFSVGGICKHAAYDRLKAVLRQDELCVGGRPVAAFGTQNLKTWREERKGLSLYELQIELCKLARKKVQSPRFRAVWPERASEVDAALKLQIMELSRKKQPVFVRDMLFVLHSPLTYMPKQYWPKDDDGSLRGEMPLGIDLGPLLPPSKPRN